MANNKKISELGPLESLSNDDEFIVVDKSTKTGDDASSTGSTSKIRFDKLKNQIGSQGEKGQKGAPSTVKGTKGEPSSVKGPRGEDGAKGNQSTVKGPRGEEGEKGNQSTVKGPRGEEGAKGNQSTVKGSKGPTGANSTVAGPKGPQGANSTVAGPKGPQGANSTVAGPKGKQGNTANANYHLGLRSTNCALSYVGHHIYKIKGNSNAWDGQIYSSQSYTGGCQVSFTPNSSGNTSCMIGLNGSSDRTSVGYQTLDFAFYQSKGNVYMYESGQIKYPSPAITCDDSTVLSIKYDNNSITYYVDDKIVRGPVPLGTGRTFHLDSSIKGPVSNTTPFTRMLSFIPLMPGPKGTPGTPGTSPTFSYNASSKTLSITNS